MKLLLKIIVLISLSSIVPAQAHHSFSLHFDMSRQMEIRGTVVDFKLRSPHASMVVDGISYIDGEPQETIAQRHLRAANIFWTTTVHADLKL